MIVAVAWGLAVLVAIVVAAFCGYELRWKGARLRAEAADLQALRALAAQFARRAVAEADERTR